MSPNEPAGIDIPVSHDFSRRGWGHDYAVRRVTRGGQSLEVMGWQTGLKQGDRILLQDGYGRSTRYRIAEIEYYPDPPDMWKAVVIFDPRTYGAEKVK